MTLKQVIKRLEGIAQAHRQINDVFVGGSDGFELEHDVI